MGDRKARDERAAARRREGHRNGGAQRAAEQGQAWEDKGRQRELRVESQRRHEATGR